MFIIASEKNKTISWPVSVEIAVDGGSIKKYEFTGKFKLLDDDQREALAEEAKAAAGVGDGEGSQWKDTSVDNIMKVMTDWAGVVDDNKEPIAFNRDNLRAAARSAHGVSILRAINTAIIEITTGARTKN